MSLIIGPQQQPSGASAFGAGLMQSAMSGMETLKQQLMKKQEQIKAVEALKNAPKDPMEAIKYFATVEGLSEQMRSNLMNNTVSMEHSRLQADAAKQKALSKREMSPAEKEVEKFKGNVLVDYMQGELNTTPLKENLDWLQENLPDLGMQKAIAGAQVGPFKNAMFKEAENRGNLVLDGVIKVFNKAGVLPQKKLEWIRDEFSISPYDTQEQMQGKINALRSLQKNASDYENRLGDLIDRYGVDISNKEFFDLRKKTNDQLSSFEQKYNNSGSRKVFDKLPPPEKHKNEIFTDQDTGEKRISNGKKWSLVK